MTKPGQSNLEERIAGYKDALAKFQDIEVVQIVDTQSDPVVAAQAAAALLQKYPDLAGIGCVEAAGGIGRGHRRPARPRRSGKVKIVSMDRGNEVLDQIKEGVITASVAQQTALMPYYAVQILYNLNNSKVADHQGQQGRRRPRHPGGGRHRRHHRRQANYKFFKR